jgi:hypothetical protein
MRRKQDSDKRERDNAAMKSTLDEQATFYKTTKESERSNELREGKLLCDEDLAKKDLER